MNISTQTDLAFPDRAVLFFCLYLECTVRLGGKTLWSYVMWGILCNIISYGQVHKIKPGPRATNIVLFEKKSQLKRRKAG